jgi:hypothetical protein
MLQYTSSQLQIVRWLHQPSQHQRPLLHHLPRHLTCPLLYHQLSHLLSHLTCPLLYHQPSHLPSHLTCPLLYHQLSHLPSHLTCPLLYHQLSHLPSHLTCPLLYHQPSHLPSHLTCPLLYHQLSQRMYLLRHQHLSPHRSRQQSRPAHPLLCHHSSLHSHRLSPQQPHHPSCLPKL